MKETNIKQGIIEWKLKISMTMFIGREGNGTPLQYSCLENPMDGGAWKAVLHGVTEGWTWLSYFTFTFPFHALEKEMETHSSVLAWRIPGMGEPGGLPSMGSHRVRHDWSDLAAAAAACLLSNSVSVEREAHVCNLTTALTAAASRTFVSCFDLVSLSFM